MPRLSIIVPVYNVEPYLKRCIDSILAQTYTDFEVILVDDGSKDTSGAICDAYAKQDNRIIVIHKENRGLSSARNAGLDVAKGELIGFVDSDDTIIPTMYENLVESLDGQDLDLVCGDTCTVRNGREKTKWLYENNRVFLGREALLENLSGKLDNSVWNKVYKKSLFDEIRFTEGIHFEDVRIMYLLLDKAKRVGYVKEAVYFYMKRKDSIIGKSFNSKSRYDLFQGYQLRWEFSKRLKLSCRDQCLSYAFQSALSTYTVLISENKKNHIYEDVKGFIERYKDKVDRSLLKSRNKMLLTFYNHAKILYVLYAKLSGKMK